MGEENEEVGDDFVYEEGSYAGASQSQTPSNFKGSRRGVSNNDMFSTSQALYRYTQMMG